MIEITEDKYSKITKILKCILEKAEIAKDLFEEDDVIEFRKGRDRYKDDDYDYRPRRGGRYM